jgi:hypothetical protein
MMIIVLLAICAFVGAIITVVSLEAGLSVWGMIGVWLAANLLVVAIFALSASAWAGP